MNKENNMEPETRHKTYFGFKKTDSLWYWEEYTYEGKVVNSSEGFIKKSDCEKDAQKHGMG